MMVREETMIPMGCPVGLAVSRAKDHSRGPGHRVRLFFPKLVFLICLISKEKLLCCFA